MSARDVIAKKVGATFGDPLGANKAEAILTALRAAGYAVVPREATLAMNIAAAQLDWSAQDDPTWPDIYRAMLAASEKEPGQ